jgi:hypothetical protein
MRGEANRDDSSSDLFGKLRADVRVTRQARKRGATDALRILFVTGEDIAKDGIYLSSTNTAGFPRGYLDLTRISRQSFVGKKGYRQSDAEDEREHGVHT